MIVPDQQDYLGPSYALDQKRDLLLDYGEQRIADMDAAGIDIAVLSAFSDGVQGIDMTDSKLGDDEHSRVQAQIDFAAKWNDQLNEIVDSAPTRYRGFAALPMAAPKAAAPNCVAALPNLVSSELSSMGPTRQMTALRTSMLIAHTMFRGRSALISIDRFTFIQE